MHYVYVLIDNNSHFYIGCTSNLKKRYSNHKKGKVISTKYKLPVKLIYYEASLSKFDAYKRERYLKSGPGHKFLKTRLRHYFK